MAKTQAKVDKEMSWGVLIVIFLIAGALAVGAAIMYFWQSDSGKPKARPSRYLTLGEHRLAIGNNSMLIQLTVEYVGAKTGKALEKAQPHLKDAVLKLLSRLHTSDLARLRTLPGKKALAGEVLETVRDNLPDEAADGVKEVLYEKFLIGE